MPYITIWNQLTEIVSNSLYMIGVILIIGILVIGIAVIIALTKRITGGNASEQKTTAKADASKHTANSIVTPNEMGLYNLLSAYANNKGCTVLIKPRIVDTIQSRLEQNNSYRIIFERIKAYHTDFVLCEKDTLSPIIGIELDDKSHNQHHRKRRDALVDKIFDAAQIPLLHLSEYSESSLTTQIDNCITQKWEQFTTKPKQPDTLRGVRWNFKIYGKSGNYSIYNQKIKQGKIPLTDEQAVELAIYIAAIRCKKNREQ